MWSGFRIGRDTLWASSFWYLLCGVDKPKKKELFFISNSEMSRWRNNCCPRLPKIKLILDNFIPSVSLHPYVPHKMQNVIEWYSNIIRILSVRFFYPNFCKSYLMKNLSSRYITLYRQTQWQHFKLLAQERDFSVWLIGWTADFSNFLCPVFQALKRDKMTQPIHFNYFISDTTGICKNAWT